MSSIKWVGLGITAVVIAGCAGVPTTSRTGMIHDVKIEEHLSPTYLRAQPGDEIRWVNHRSQPVTIEFLGKALDGVTCQAGFTTFFGGQQEMATIDPNESVSLCFGNAGTITYNARMDSAVAGGQLIESGTIQLGR